MRATDEVYSFWLYEVCDVYIEAIKDITAEGAPLEAKRSAQHTLYTVLDNGLRLLHPIMPFVTEELWQRLPRRPTDQTKSIMLAKYPVQASLLSFSPFARLRANLASLQDPTREFTEAEKDFDLAFNAIRSIRSVATGYNLNSKLQGEHLHQLVLPGALSDLPVSRSHLPRSHSRPRCHPPRCRESSPCPDQGLRHAHHRRVRG